MHKLPIDCIYKIVEYCSLEDAKLFGGIRVDIDKMILIRHLSKFLEEDYSLKETSIQRHKDIIKYNTKHKNGTHINEIFNVGNNAMFGRFYRNSLTIKDYSECIRYLKLIKNKHTKTVVGRNIIDPAFIDNYNLYRANIHIVSMYLDDIKIAEFPIGYIYCIPLIDRDGKNMYLGCKSDSCREIYRLSKGVKLHIE